MGKPTVKVRSGDIICVDRGLYRHYGVYDNGEVIDISPADGNNGLQNKYNAYIRKRSLSSFANGNPVYIINAILP